MLHPTFLTRLRFRSADNAGGVIRPTRLTQRVIGHSSSLGAPALSTGGPRFAEAVEAFEKALLGDALARHHGNLTQASQDLGMAKTTLFDKVKKYGLQ